jgi:hypothetical protein
MVGAGVMVAQSITGPPAGTVSLMYVTGIPSRPGGDPNHVRDVVSASLNLTKHTKDAEKLDAAGAATRHLFLWIDPLTRADIGRALREGVPIVAPLSIRISQLWLGLPDGTDVRVLRWAPDASWQLVRAPQF